MTIIEIRPHRGGWQCNEGAGVAPYFIGSDAKEKAISYATPRMSGRRGEIRIYDDQGEDIAEVRQFWPQRHE